MTEGFRAERDQFIAYAVGGAATINFGGEALEALPGPIRPSVPPPPPGYLLPERDLDALRAMLIGAQCGAGIVGRAGAAGVKGMPGVGKSVLAAAVARDAEVERTFTYGVIWLPVGRNADVLQLLATAALAITGKRPGYANVVEARTDLRRLLDQKQLLIVLDDVWDGAVADGFAGLAPACQLLVTTRLQAVVTRARAEPYEVGLLNPSDARELFAEVYGSTNALAEAETIIKHCGGVRLAIAAAARMVRDKGLETASRAFEKARLDRLKTEWLPGDGSQSLAAVLAASVDVLGSCERACLLESAAWPEDVSVAYTELCLFWSEHAADEDDLRDIADALVAASVLQPGSRESVRLHDLYHDYLRHLAGERLPTMHGNLADRCVRFAADGAVLLEQGTWVARFLPWHLLQAGRADAAKRLLFDFEWLAFKLARVGVNALISDAKLETLAADPEVETLGRVLRLSAHVLVRDPGQLGAQLLGRFHDRSSGLVTALLDRARERSQKEIVFPRDGRHLIGPGALVAALAGHTGPVMARCCCWMG